MNLTNACPTNAEEVVAASELLGCSEDRYGNNQYVCLPNAEKTSLVQICYDGFMGLQEKGNCLELSDGSLTLKSCSHFASGCPPTHFRTSELYKYPACYTIHPSYKCYTSDPFCMAEFNKNNPYGHNNLGIIIVLLLVLVISLTTISILVFCLWKKVHKIRKFRTSLKEQEDNEPNTKKGAEYIPRKKRERNDTLTSVESCLVTLKDEVN